MLKNLFKKSKSVEAVIAEIHNEFDSASEKLLKEAKEILSVNAPTDKGDRLKSLGFSQALPVVESEKARQEKAEKKALAEKIEYYQQWYPQNKFITEAMVEQICKKYGLVCGAVSYYKGDVPEKNILEIERFVLRKEDMQRKRLPSITDWEYQQYMMQNRGLLQFSTRRSELSQLQNLIRPLPVYTQSSPDDSRGKRKYEYTKPEFKICAPEKDFDMTFLKRNRYNLELNIPDPVVLQPVSGGYLVVSKWGLEASDELVISPKQN